MAFSFGSAVEKTAQLDQIFNLNKSMKSLD